MPKGVTAPPRLTIRHTSPEGELGFKAPERRAQRNSQPPAISDATKVQQEENKKNEVQPKKHFSLHPTWHTLSSLCSEQTQNLTPQTLTNPQEEMYHHAPLRPLAAQRPPRHN